MCGFTGSISLHEIDNKEVELANKVIECRGPDSTNFTQKKHKNKFVSLCFNRLAILDLAEIANQPMYSADFKTTLLFNGEIYNHKELRTDLKNKGLKFQTSHSDSETLLIGISYYGLDFINKIRGQFAIVFLDEKNDKLYLIRDRLGQKPLYFTYNDQRINFGSSLLSLLPLEKNYSLDVNQAYNYLNYGKIISPNTLFKNLYKVEPAQVLAFDLNKDKFEMKKFKYWDIKDYLSDDDFDNEYFFDIFSESINIRASADVPVSNLLSGGIDSTSIIKNMVDSHKEVNSFSIYLTNSKYDESNYIKEVVNKYQINHRAVSISSNITKLQILEALDCLDEPYSDPSVVPSYIISKEISKYFKVAISGDGGDELLGGYKRTMLSLNKGSFVGDVFSKLITFYPSFLGSGNKFLLNSTDLEKKYRSFLEDHKLLKLLGVKSSEYNYADDLSYLDNNYFKNLLISDYRFFLPEMMMFKIDRTSMANSLEIRSPFVDHKLIEYIMSTKNSYIDTSNSKMILKNYLNQDFEKDFLQRKKQGFVFDVEKWVYNNINFIIEVISNGEIIKNLNQNAISLLQLNKSRINGQRIWRLFVLENYISKISSR